MSERTKEALFRGKELSTAGSLLIMAGFFYSFAAMSIGMFLLAGIALWRILLNGSRRIHRDALQRFTAFFKRPEWSAPVLVLVAVLVSGAWSSSLEDWWWFMRLKLPFFVLPFAFFNLPSWTAREMRLLEGVFIGIAFFSTLPVMHHIAFHYEEVSESLKRGQAVPTPTNHIRYSMLLAYGAAIALYRALGDIPAGRRTAYLFTTVWLTASLFIFSTRTGIVVLAGELLYLFVWLVWSRGKMVWGLALLLAVSVSAALAVQFTPTLKDKISYMRYDWQRMTQGQGARYSDSERWMSIEAGWQLWLDSPLTGVGMGDLETASAGYYRENYGRDTYKYPHNQLVFVLATTGLVGLMIFLAGMLIPLSGALLFRRPETVLLYVNIFIAGMAEHCLETATGITFFCFFLAFYTKYHQGR